MTPGKYAGARTAQANTRAAHTPTRAAQANTRAWVRRARLPFRALLLSCVLLLVACAQQGPPPDAFPEPAPPLAPTDASAPATGPEGAAEAAPEAAPQQGAEAHTPGAASGEALAESAAQAAAPGASGTAPAAITPPGWQIDMTGYYLGVPVGRASGAVRLDEEAYQVKFAAHATGLLKLLTNWSEHFETTGALAPGTPMGLEPSDYLSTRHRRGKTRIRRLRFFDGLAEIVDEQGAVAKVSRVPPEMRRGAVDFMTPILVIGAALARERHCNLRIPTFDGRRRIDAVLRDEGIETLRIDGASLKTRRCAFVLERLAGYSERDLRAAPYVGWLWFRDFGDPRLWLPVKARVDLRPGDGVAYIRPRPLARAADTDS